MRFLTAHAIGLFFRMRVLCFLLATVVSVAACKSSRQVADAPLLRLPPLQESFIYVPVKIYAKPFLQRAESMAPQTFTSNGWPAFEAAGCDFQYKYRFVRSALGFSCINNKVLVNMVGSYQIAGSKSICAFGRQVSPWISGSCGFAPEPMRRVQIQIGSQLSIEAGGKIVSRSALEKITAVDKCTVTLMNTDITSMITDSIRSSVNAFSGFLDKAVSQLNYAGVISNIATITGKKIPLSSYGWLKLNPSAIHAGKINYSKDTIYLTAGFGCYPEIGSDSVNYQVTRFLPPVSETTEAPGFSINANTAYDYQFLDSMLSRFARQNSFELEGRQVKINQVALRGLGNNRIEMQLQFTGSFRGTLKLTGTPRLDVNSQQISVPDLDYSLQSGDLLLNMGKTLYNKKIINTLRQKAVLNVADLVQKNKTSLDSMLTRQVSPYVKSDGKISSIRANAMVVNKDNLLMQVSAKGLLSLSVSPPQKF
jgi:hypothetical protein